VPKGNRISFKKLSFTLSPNFGRNCRKWLSPSDWNAVLQKVFDGFSFWFCVWFYWISLSKSTMKEICSFYETKINMERRITSLQCLCVLLWSFLIPLCKRMNQTRKAPLDIFSLLFNIWVAYNPFVNIRPFVREKGNSWVSILTLHEVRSNVAGASVLTATAQYNKNWSATLTIFDIQFLNNEPPECNSVFCSIIGLNYCFLCYIH